MQPEGSKSWGRRKRRGGLQKERSGGALQKSCKVWSLSLISCFAIKKLSNEDKLALYNDQAHEGLGRLYDESQEVFLETETVQIPFGGGGWEGTHL